MPKVFVKWGAQKLEVDVNTDLEPLVLKSQLFELTGVIPERQKVVIKGKTVKDDNWQGITLQDGAMLMMLGSTASVPQQSSSSEEQGNRSVITGQEKDHVLLPTGLDNFGNSCYLNATLQSLLTIPELVNGVKQWSDQGCPTIRDSMMRNLTGSLHTLFTNLTNGKGTYANPLLSLKLLRNVYPQFGTTGPHGEPQQQDANESFTVLLRELSNAAEITVGKEGKKVSVRSFVEGQLELSFKNLENEEEPIQKAHDSFIQLSCFLTQDVRYLQSGIKSKMTEEIEKFSDTLNRNCRYEKTALVNRLPAYMSAQVVRFFYKEKDHINAKILKDVKFPIILDVFDLCTPELKTKLRPQRDAFKETEDKKVEILRSSKVGDEEIPAKKPDKFAPTSFEDDPGSNNSGYYQLNAIITHKGRSSNSGHYVAWVRIDEEKWAMCDDNEVHGVTEDQILKLSGGGDWHCAYVLLYGPRPLPILD